MTGQDVVDEPSRPTPVSGIGPPDDIVIEEIQEATLDLIVSLASCALEGADWASVSLLSQDEDELHTPSATSEEVRTVDAVQYATEQGPCVLAVRTRDLVNISIGSVRRRWPEFTAEAEGCGVASVLAVPLATDRGVMGALNIYSKRPEVFDQHAEQAARHLARHAAVVLTSVSHLMTRHWVDLQLAEAVSRADVVGQAKGILMARGYSAEEAGAALRRSSQRTNRRLRDVAEDMVAWGRLGRSSS